MREEAEGEGVRMGGSEGGGRGWRGEGDLE